jgi:hypothetical protein
LVAIVLFSVSGPVLAFEQPRGLGALGRSYRLTAFRLGTSIMCVLGAAFMNWVITIGLSGVVTFALRSNPFASDQSWEWMPMAAANLLGATIANALSACVACVLYLDLRSRREGWDLRREMVAAFAIRRTP